jgi:hypothetical protein
MALVIAVCTVLEFFRVLADVDATLGRLATKAAHFQVPDLVA